VDPTRNDHIPALGWLLTVIMAVRLGFPRLFGLLDNDSIVIFTDAERFIETGTVSMMSTLHVLLVALFYQVIEVGLPAARWVSVLAGLGVMLLLFLRGLDEGDRRIGVFAAILFAVIPITVFYGVSALPYGALTFFSFFGVWLLARALERSQPLLGLLAGLAFGAAFLCKTFAAALILPAGIYFLVGLFGSRAKGRAWKAPLLAILAWAVVVAGAVIWRFPAFGWSVFNDYITDWRFDIARSVWSGRWVGLVNLHALMLPLLAPGLVLAWKRGRRRSFDGLCLWYALAVIAVYLLNPVNHFPRVLLPLTPVLAWFAGRELALLTAERRPSGALPAWLITILLLATSLWWWPGWLDDPRPLTMLVAVAVALAVFFPLTLVKAMPRAWMASLLLIGATVFGLVNGYRALDRVERAYGARIEAIKAADTTDGVLGGGDVVPYVAHGENNYATLTDFPRDRLFEVLKFGLAPVLRDMNIRAVVVDRYDTEGAVAMLGEVAASMNVQSPWADDPFASLDEDPGAMRLFDNGNFALYMLDDIPLYEQRSYPSWSKVEPQWDRTGLMTVHPTAAKLRIAQRPPAEGDYIPGTDRRVIVELSDRPGGEEHYDLLMILYGEKGNELWRYTRQVAFDDNGAGLGVRLLRLTLGRDKPRDDDDRVQVPREITGARTLRVKATPIGGAQPMHVMVRLPVWW